MLDYDLTADEGDIFKPALIYINEHGNTAIIFNKEGAVKQWEEADDSFIVHYFDGYTDKTLELPKSQTKEYWYNGPDDLAYHSARNIVGSKGTVKYFDDHLKYVKNNSIIRQTKYDPHSIRKSLDDEYKTFPTLIYTKDNIAIIFDSSESSWEYRYLKVKINTNYEGIDLTLEVPEGSVTAIDCISPNLDEAFKYAYEVSGIVIKIKDYIEGYNNYLTSGIENKGHNKK